MKLLYDAAAGGRPLGGADEDRARFDGYLKACQAANGPEQALAERWLQTVSGSTDD